MQRDYVRRVGTSLITEESLRLFQKRECFCRSLAEIHHRRQIGDQARALHGGKLGKPGCAFHYLSMKTLRQGVIAGILSGRRLGLDSEQPLPLQGWVSDLQGQKRD